MFSVPKISSRLDAAAPILARWISGLKLVMAVVHIVNHYCSFKRVVLEREHFIFCGIPFYKIHHVSLGVY